MTYVPTKEVKIKEKQDKILREQLQKEREQQLLEEIEKTEKERIRKKGKAKLSNQFRVEDFKKQWHFGRLPEPADFALQVRASYR